MGIARYKDYDFQSPIGISKESNVCEKVIYYSFSKRERAVALGNQKFSLTDAEVDYILEVNAPEKWVRVREIFNEKVNYF